LEGELGSSESEPEEMSAHETRFPPTVQRHSKDYCHELFKTYVADVAWQDASEGGAKLRKLTLSLLRVCALLNAYLTPRALLHVRTRVSAVRGSVMAVENVDVIAVLSAVLDLVRAVGQVIRIGDMFAEFQDDYVAFTSAALIEARAVISKEEEEKRAQQGFTDSARGLLADLSTALEAFQSAR
jgi:hypothetical protein